MRDREDDSSAELKIPQKLSCFNVYIHIGISHIKQMIDDLVYALKHLH